MPRGHERPIQSSFEYSEKPQSFDAISIDASNADVVSFLRDAADWPFPSACLVGPEKSGRSTLAACWANRLAGQGVEAVLIDPAEPVNDEAALLTTLNRATQLGARILLTATHAPQTWAVANRDLASRLDAMPVTQIKPLTLETMMTRIRVLLARRLIDVPEDVLRFLELRLNRSYADIEACATRIAGAAGSDRGLTVKLARSVLQDMYGRDLTDSWSEDE